MLEPNLVAELIPDFPPDCRFDYFAPVLKERERRSDGLFHILVLWPSWCYGSAMTPTWGGSAA
ncbi:hypothetical protein [Sodalinema gerasimenkoae]|uniref:hypothetical protein n=1 Tax=Sodalinema gerasimenkoae TaxID=2862348 RepID=UPI003CCE0F9D